MTQPSPYDIAHMIEFGEAQAYASMYEFASPEAAERYGIRVRQIGSATARQFAAIDFTLFNAVIGLGLTEPATTEMVDEIIDFYRPAGVSFVIQLSPFAQPAELPQWLEARGFQARDRWPKMYRAVQDPPSITTDIEIRQIGPKDADAFAETALAGFEMPLFAHPLLEILKPTVGTPNWRHYLGYDGGRPVSTSALFIHNDVGGCGIGSTLPAYRRRGAQGAMFARRIGDAAAVGCRWIITETGEDTPERPNPSYHNMVRTGFQLAYMRPNYLYKAGE